MKKTILAVVAVAAISTNCTASEVVGTANTVAQSVASATNVATLVAKKYEGSDEQTVTVVNSKSQEDTAEEGKYPFKWMNAGKSKLDEVLGGREAIKTLREENEELKVELRGLKARTSFTGKNLKPFASSIEEVCYLYDGGGIKEALGGE